jgi:hypothetical protein
MARRFRNIQRSGFDAWVGGAPMLGSERGEGSRPITIGAVMVSAHDKILLRLRVVVKYRSQLDVDVWNLAT